MKLVMEVPWPERDQLISSLAWDYAKDSLEGNEAPAVILEYLNMFGEVLEPYKDARSSDLAIEVLARESAGILAGLAPTRSTELMAVLGSDAHKTGNAITVGILGESFASALKKEQEYDLTKLGSLGDAKVKASAEKALLRRGSTQEVANAVNMATYYLGGESSPGSDHQIEINLFSEGVASHPKEVSEAILASRPGLKKDKAIELMIYRIAPTDPELARSWFDMIQDPEARKRAQKDISGTRIREKEHPDDALFR